MSGARLALDYIRVLVWPVLVGLVLFGFRRQFLHLLPRMSKAQLGALILEFKAEQLAEDAAALTIDADDARAAATAAIVSSGEDATPERAPVSLRLDRHDGPIAGTLDSLDQAWGAVERHAAEAAKGLGLPIAQPAFVMEKLAQQRYVPSSAHILAIRLTNSVAAVLSGRVDATPQAILSLERSCQDLIVSLSAGAARAQAEAQASGDSTTAGDTGDRSRRKTSPRSSTVA